MLALFLLTGYGLVHRIEARRDWARGDGLACDALSQIRADDARRAAAWQAEEPLRGAQAVHEAQIRLIRSQTETNEALKRKLSQLVFSSSATATSAAPRGAIGDYVRRCWSTELGTPGWMEVLIMFTTHAAGVVRLAGVAPESAERVNADPQLKRFAERAIRAVLDPNCANLPLSPPLLGQPRIFTFRFRP